MPAGPEGVTVDDRVAAQAPPLLGRYHLSAGQRWQVTDTQPHEEAERGAGLGELGRVPAEHVTGVVEVDAGVDPRAGRHRVTHRPDLVGFGAGGEQLPGVNVAERVRSAHSLTH